MNAMMSAPAKAPKTPALTDSYRVLVVGNGATSRAVLESLKYEVTMVASAAEAIDAFHRQAPDLCLVDLRLPDMRGLQLLHLLQSMDASVPCVIVSPTRDLHDIFDAHKNGAVDFLVTPLEPKRAALTLAHAVGMSRRDDVSSTLAKTSKNRMLELLDPQVRKSWNP